jgi:hypothetical protein
MRSHRSRIENPGGGLNFHEKSRPEFINYKQAMSMAKEFQQRFLGKLFFILLAESRFNPLSALWMDYLGKA